MNYSLQMSRKIDDRTQIIIASIENGATATSTQNVKTLLKTWCNYVFSFTGTDHTVTTAKVDSFVRSQSINSNVTGSKADIQLIFKANISGEAETVIADLTEVTSANVATALTSLLTQVFTGTTDVGDVICTNVNINLHD